MQVLSAVQVLMFIVVTLKQPVTGNVTHYVSHVGWMELPSAIFTLWIIRPKDSGAAFEQKKSLWMSGHACG